MRRNIGCLVAAIICLIAILGATSTPASASSTYGQGDSAYDAYYANPSDQSTWAAFCAGAGDGASYSGVQALGVPACGPTPSNDSVGIYIGSDDQGGPTEYGFQCVELAERYLWVKEGWAPINSSDGAQVVKNYAAQHSLPIVQNGAGQAPAVGAVMSFSSTSTFSDVGHVAVVTASSVNSSGSGSVTIVGENQDSLPGFSGFTDKAKSMKVGAAAGLPAWTIKSFDSNSYIEWLVPPGVGIPTVTNFTASPSTLPSSGGQVTLSANVTNATSCTFASNKTVSGLTSAPCSNGTVSDVVTVPAIGTKASASYRFGLSVAGSKIISAPSIKFLESGAPPPSVSQLTATPSTLTSAGGIVSLVTELANATTCKFTSSRPVTGLSSSFKLFERIVGRTGSCACQ